MIRRQWCGLLGASACAVALFLGGGCDSPKVTSSNAEATVHGTIKVKSGPSPPPGPGHLQPCQHQPEGYAPTAKAEIS